MKVINLRDIYPHYTQDYDERVPYRMSKRKSRKSKQAELGNSFIFSPSGSLLTFLPQMLMCHKVTQEFDRQQSAIP